MEGKKEERKKRNKAGNPLSTFCYLSVQGDALGQLVHGHLAVEVALLGRGADLHHDGDGDHHGDEEEAHAVDDHLQVGVVGLMVVGDGWGGGGGETRGEWWSGQAGNSQQQSVKPSAVTANRRPESQNLQHKSV